MYGWRTWLVFCYYPVTVSEQILPHVNIRIRSTISAHRNANGLLEDLVSKDYIDIVYKKAKHTFNVCFRVLVWAIKMVSHKIYILFPNHYTSISTFKLYLTNQYQKYMYNISVNIVKNRSSLSPCLSLVATKYGPSDETGKKGDLGPVSEQMWYAKDPSLFKDLERRALA
jgi:hypothetical protein